jgi:hypothetical protein
MVEANDVTDALVMASFCGTLLFTKFTVVYLLFQKNQNGNEGCCVIILQIIQIIQIIQS